LPRSGYFHCANDREPMIGPTRRAIGPGFAHELAIVVSGASGAVAAALDAHLGVPPALAAPLLAVVLVVLLRRWWRRESKVSADVALVARRGFGSAVAVFFPAATATRR